MSTAKLIINDEVNVKIEGLDADTRRKLSNKFSYEIPGARHMPAYRLGRWNGKVSFFSLAGYTYINLLPEILPVLAEDGYEIDLEDNRDYVKQFEFEPVAEDSFAHIAWPSKHPLAGQPIMLRDYQVAAINNCLLNYQSLSKLPTGAGKTIVTAALSQRCEKYGRTIVVVPNQSLVTQTEADYINLQLDVGVFYGPRKEFGKTHTICTWQSLNSLLKQTKEGKELDITFGEFVEGVECIIIDECHQAKAAVLKDLLTQQFSKVQIRWGLTGTIPKEDFEFRSLQVSLGDIANTMQASDLQDMGVLSNCHVHVKQLVDYAEYKDYQSELKYLLESEKRVDYIASMISKISKEGNTLVLIDRVGPGKQLASLIKDAVFISGATKAAARTEQYDDVATADNKILIATYGVAAVGINVPRIFNLVLIEPGKSFVRVIQSIGRGLRKAQDKDWVDIYDITSTCKFAKRHLTTRKKYYAESKYSFTIDKIDWQV